jgi:hypothetical protein
VYVIAIKNLLQAEFLQVVPVSLLQPKNTICCRARDTVEYESRQSYKKLMVATFQIWVHYLFESLYILASKQALSEGN